VFSGRWGWSTSLSACSLCRVLSTSVRRRTNPSAYSRSCWSVVRIPRRTLDPAGVSYEALGVLVGSDSLRSSLTPFAAVLASSERDHHASPFDPARQRAVPTPPRPVATVARSVRWSAAPPPPTGTRGASLHSPTSQRSDRALPIGGREQRARFSRAKRVRAGRSQQRGATRLWKPGGTAARRRASEASPTVFPWTSESAATERGGWGGARRRSRGLSGSSRQHSRRTTEPDRGLSRLSHQR